MLVVQIIKKINWSPKNKMADKIKMAVKHEFSITQDLGRTSIKKNIVEVTFQIKSRWIKSATTVLSFGTYTFISQPILKCKSACYDKFKIGLHFKIG
jgi:hypothetical protein